MKRGSEFRHYRLRVRVRVRIYRLEPHFSVAGGACVHSRSGAQGKWQRESLRSGFCSADQAAYQACRGDGDVRTGGGEGESARAAAARLTAAAAGWAAARATATTAAAPARAGATVAAIN